MPEFNLKEYLHNCRAVVDERLHLLVSELVMHQAFPGLSDSISYSLFAGGKRFRPILLIASHEIFAPLTGYALNAACAIEFLHTYSLIHDDLPSFDDDGLRRGRPTNHIKFGEWMAILAGDSLSTVAFETLSGGPGDVAESLKLSAINLISAAVGPAGMALGQAMDMAYEGQGREVDEILQMQELKTGKLITAAVEVGAVLSGAAADDCRRLRQHGMLVGRAFQVRDDLLDLEGGSAQLGKSFGKDGSIGKVTLPSLIGGDRARTRAERWVEEAIALLDDRGELAVPLRAIARYSVARDY